MRTAPQSRHDAAGRWENTNLIVLCIWKVYWNKLEAFSVRNTKEISHDSRFDSLVFVKMIFAREATSSWRAKSAQ